MENILRQDFQFSKFADKLHRFMAYVIQNELHRINNFHEGRTLMLPSILRLANNLRSSSSGVSGTTLSNSAVAFERFSNSVRHLFNNNIRKVHGLGGLSKLGASSLSRLHSCAYIELYFGSSRAFSKIWKIKWRKIGVEISDVGTAELKVWAIKTLISPKFLLVKKYRQTERIKTYYFRRSFKH